jgi:hypothetical protein
MMHLETIPKGNQSSGVEVIIRPLSPKQPAAPQRAVALGFPIRSKESKSFSNAEKDSELLAS